MAFNIKLNLLNSLGFKVMTMLMLGLGISFSLMVLHLSSSKLSALMELGETASRNQTLLAAGQARAGIERRDESYLENIYFDLVFSQDDEGYETPAIQMLRVADADGRGMKSYETLDGPHVSPERLDDMARIAMDTGALHESREGDLILISAPVFADMNRDVIGAISIAWDHGHLRSEVMLATLKSGVFALVAASALMLAIGSVMQRLVLRPISSLARSVEQIQLTGDLMNMPKSITERRDEIGDLAARFKVLLAQSNEMIIARRNQLDTALESMAQGICLFDGEQRLVMSNHRLEKIYGLAPGTLAPGMPLGEVLEACKAAGNYSDERVAGIVSAMSRSARTVRPSTHLEPIANSRIVAISRAPMPDGGWVATFEDVTERRRTEARIEHMALHDSLTDLPNRPNFHAQLDEALKSLTRGQDLAVLCLDLDHFKAVNDTLGHPVGDALLQQVATRLRGCLRHSSVLARLSGDEFAIIEKNLVSIEEAGQLAERVVGLLSEPYEVSGHQIVIGTCVGIATAPADGADADKLVKAADLALYRAKSEGRSTYRFFEPEMDTRMRERRSLELDLRAAFAKDELEVHYQPIVNLETGRVTCVEALLRWQHETRGAVAPDKFVALAEEIGLISQLGAWVLKQACHMAAQLPDDVHVAVNLSPMQFRSMALVSEVQAAHEASGVAAERLELEITETVLLRQTDLTLSILDQLRGLGVRISMDDFGTGYSSLGYLRAFSFDKIKIDRSFIRDLAHHGDAQAIVRAISSMGASLGIATTAEGVETLDQLEKLRNEGCTEVQGYYFSPAVHCGEVLQLIRRIGANSQPALRDVTRLTPAPTCLLPLPTPATIEVQRLKLMEARNALP